MGLLILSISVGAVLLSALVLVLVWQSIEYSRRRHDEAFEATILYAAGVPYEER